MTVKELRNILMAEWLPEDLIIWDYDDRKIRDVNVVIDSDGTISEIRIAMAET